MYIQQPSPKKYQFKKKRWWENITREIEDKISCYKKYYSEMFKMDLIDRATPSEKFFLQCIKKHNIPLVFQQIIYYKDNNNTYHYYIIDFCDVKKKLAIEIDGEYHYTPEQREADKQRDFFLRKCGFTIIRINNYEIHSIKVKNVIKHYYPKYF